jgi:hypothetical protein
VLDRLLQQFGSSGGPFEVKVVTGQPSYHFGDGIRIGMRVAEDCYYVLLHRDAKGHYTPVSPRGSDDNMLRAGEKYVLPREGVIRVSPPAGREQFILICSKRETPLSGSPNRGDIALSTVTYEVME